MALTHAGIARRRVAVACPLALLLLLAGAVRADWPLTILALQHRPAEELLPLLAPLAGADGGVSGSGATLFVRAAPGRLAEIRAALDRLDVPARSLLVQVRRAQVDRVSRRGVAVRIDEPVGAGGGVRLGPARGPAGAGSGVWADAGEREASDEVLYQVRVLDGGTAFIGIGGLQPMARQETLIGPGGSVTRRTIGYAETGSGFYVRPRLQGARVVVDLAGRAGGFADRGGEVATQVSGAPGEWLPVGTITQSLVLRERSLAARADGQGALALDLELRVVPVE